MSTQPEPLTADEQSAFRKDFQDKEAEINRYITIYLSAIAVVTGWLIGPQSKTAVELVTGNNGYNILGWYSIVLINIVFSCFLAYKGLIIHDVTQFMTYLAPAESGFMAWESWRRSPYSATRRVRPAYAIIIAGVPLLVAAAALAMLWRILHVAPQQWAQWANAAVGNHGPEVDVAELTNAFALSRQAWWCVLLLHAIPLWFFFESVGPTNRRWQRVLATRPDLPVFKHLRPHTSARTAQTLAGPNQGQNVEPGDELVHDQCDDAGAAVAGRPIDGTP